MVNFSFSGLFKKGTCACLGFDMHILKSHSHTRTHYKREIYTTGIRKKNEKKSQRINVSVVTQNITDEVKLQVQ